MKKIIVAAAVVITSGVLSIYVNNKPSQQASATVKIIFYDYKKELGNGD
jgi:hypothetical protein